MRMDDADYGFQERDPDADGFRAWALPANGRFIDLLGLARSRVEGDRVRSRTVPDRSHSSGLDMLHGGFLQAYIDQALFYGLVALGRMQPGEGVTLSSSIDFVGPGRTNQPLDAIVELAGETRRTFFVRGIVEQEGRPIANFQATIRRIGGGEDIR